MLDTLRSLTTQRHAADVAWRSAVIKASETHSLSVVAAAAGITRGRVHQIVKADRDA